MTRASSPFVGVHRRAVGPRLSAASPLTRAERTTLFAVGVAYISPIVFLNGSLLATEIAMGLFVLAAHWHIRAPGAMLPIYAAFSVPFAFAVWFPTPGFSVVVCGLILMKLCLFATFAYYLSERCRNRENAFLVGKVLLAVAAVLCGTALINLNTEWNGFAWWKAHLYTSDLRPGGYTILESGFDPQIVDPSWRTGLTSRPRELPPWSFIGITTAGWLFAWGRIRGLTASILILMAGAAALSLPQRSVLICIAVGFFTYALVLRAGKWRLLGVLALAGLAAAAAMFRQLGGEADLGLGVEALAPVERFARMGFSDDRIQNLPAEIWWLLTNARTLLLGSGWSFSAGHWTRPHSSYVGFVVGGGIITALVVGFGIARLFRRNLYGGTVPGRAVMATVAMAVGVVEIAINPYFLDRLDFPASTLAAWIAWAAVMYVHPEPGQPTRRVTRSATSAAMTRNLNVTSSVPVAVSRRNPVWN
jgi:hypothetical protein